jgi:hypothetical protein
MSVSLPRSSAFWWIAGDCLGFRRDAGLARSGKPYSFCPSLRHGPDRIIPYDRQLRVLCAFGYALWDICQSCERPGSSLDQDIVEEVPNPIRDFCDEHPTIRRIVIANGSTASKIFGRHFASWFASGELVPSDDDRSQRAFPRSLLRKSSGRSPTSSSPSPSPSPSSPIAVVVAIGVSGAAASYTYEEKREFWETHVYRPGLELLQSRAPAADTR